MTDFDINDHQAGTIPCLSSTIHTRLSLEASVEGDISNTRGVKRNADAASK